MSPLAAFIVLTVLLSCRKLILIEMLLIVNDLKYE